MKHTSNEMLTKVCEFLMEWDVSLEDVRLIASDLPGEFEAMIRAENERAWEAQQERLRESGGPDDSHYRKTMRDAGRGHLLR